MLDITEQAWEKREGDIIALLGNAIELMEEMICSFQNDYSPRKITLFRLLCAGFLIIGKNNVKASILLIENNLPYQIHYISRNMFEMVVTLYFIDNDPANREELTKRYFDYQNVQKHQTMKTMDKYPTIPQEFRTKEADKEIEKSFTAFCEKYRTKNGGKPKLTTWSGSDLCNMMGTITNNYKRNDLFTGYDIMNRWNNYFLHPTVEYLKNITKGKVDSKTRVALLESVYISVSQIIEKYLENFRKNRPVFRKKVEDIEDNYREITRKFLNCQSVR